MQIYRTFSTKNVCIIIFFRVLCSLTKKWIYIIDYLYVLKHCNSYNFDLIKKFYKENLSSLLKIIRKCYSNIGFFQRVVFKKIKNSLIFYSDHETWPFLKKVKLKFYINLINVISYVTRMQKYWFIIYSKFFHWNSNFCSNSI